MITIEPAIFDFRYDTLLLISVLVDMRRVIKHQYLWREKGRDLAQSYNLDKTNQPISSNNHPPATANIAKHCLKRGGGVKPNGNII